MVTARFLDLLGEFKRLEEQRRSIIFIILRASAKKNNKLLYISSKKFAVYFVLEARNLEDLSEIYYKWEDDFYQLHNGGEDYHNIYLEIGSKGQCP